MLLIQTQQSHIDFTGKWRLICQKIPIVLLPTTRNTVRLRGKGKREKSEYCRLLDFRCDRAPSLYFASADKVRLPRRNYPTARCSDRTLSFSRNPNTIFGIISTLSQKRQESREQGRKILALPAHEGCKATKFIYAKGKIFITL